jgi:hypothetical protein
LVLRLLVLNFFKICLYFNQPKNGIVGRPT